MAGSTKTLGLAFIAKTPKQAQHMKKRWSRYFDEVFYRVGPVADFAAARNEVLDTVTTDYWFWVDTDDDVIGVEKLRVLVQQMAERSIDLYYFPYEYGFNEQGELDTLHWRERLIRTGAGLRWRGAVHEAIDHQDSVVADKTDEVVIRHVKSTDDHIKAAARNHTILEREWKREQDPRIAMYLGMSWYKKGNYSKAIKFLTKHIETSGWVEDQYRSWTFISRAHNELSEPQQSEEAALRAALLLPDRPEAYVLLAFATYEHGEYLKSLEWLKVASTKSLPDTISAVDPTMIGYRAEWVAALNYLHLGKVKEAYLQLRKVLEHSPNFGPAKTALPLFEAAYYEKEAIDRVKWLAEWEKEGQGDPQKLLQSLPPSVFADVRLNSLRAQVFPSRKWSDKSIVFFCGHSAEQWGPDTLGQGLGGSEEAVLYLSRELAKLGWDVHVYNDREEDYTDRWIGDRKEWAELWAYKDNELWPKVYYHPWTTLNPNDDFNVFISWRNPSFFRSTPIKARLKGVDMHDTPLGHVSITGKDIVTLDKVFFKSDFQRHFIEGLPDEKCAVIPNGVVIEQFNHEVKRNPLKVVYGSSPDRGLEMLLELWPQIKEQVSAAELHWYYGWDSFDQFHRSNPKLMKWKLDMLRKLHKAGCVVHGRVDHETLAKEYLSAGVWAYPTAFAEIDCITAAKAQIAGCTPITSGYAALQTSVEDPEEDFQEKMYHDPAAQQTFVKRLLSALKHPESETVRGTRAKKVAAKRDWATVAQQWDRALQ